MQKKWVIIICISLLLGWFFWFQLRPSIIRNQCHTESVNRAKEMYKRNNPNGKDGIFNVDAYDNVYEICLHEKGLK